EGVASGEILRSCLKRRGCPLHAAVKGVDALTSHAKNYKRRIFEESGGYATNAARSTYRYT
ncbi:hypothetical protein CEXT_68191, partial [Caerostris extrusa]